jgi:hypothetical protein
MAASISSGIGGTMVFSDSGRFSVMVATAPAVEYSSVSKSVVGIAEAKPLRTQGSRASAPTGDS